MQFPDDYVPVNEIYLHQIVKLDALSRPNEGAALK